MNRKLVLLLAAIAVFMGQGRAVASSWYWDGMQSASYETEAVWSTDEEYRSERDLASYPASPFPLSVDASIPDLACVRGDMNPWMVHVYSLLSGGYESTSTFWEATTQRTLTVIEPTMVSVPFRIHGRMQGDVNIRWELGIAGQRVSGSQSGWLMDWDDPYSFDSAWSAPLAPGSYTFFSRFAGRAIDDAPIEEIDMDMHMRPVPEPSSGLLAVFGLITIVLTMTARSRRR
jgi:hypothetical protein